MPLVTPIQNWRTYVVHTQFLHGTVPPHRTSRGWRVELGGSAAQSDKPPGKMGRRQCRDDAVGRFNAGLFARHRRGRPLGCPAGNDGPLAGVVGPTGNGGICRLPPVVASIDPPDQPRLRRPCH